MASTAKHDWPMVRLGDVCEISIGKTPARKNPEYWGEGYPWLSIRDMNQGRSLSDTAEQITDLAVRETSPRLCEPGTVLFSFKLSIGKVGIAQIPLYTNEAIAAFVPLEPETLLNEYLFHALQYFGANLEGQRAVMGKTLNKASLSRITIPLPPLDEQRRIAAILDEVQRLTDLQESCLTAFDQLIDSLTEAITELKSESLGKLGVSFVSGKSLTGNARNAHPVNKVLKVSAISSGAFLAEEAKPLPADYSPPTSHLVALGDVLFCRANGSRELIGVTAKVDQELSNYYLPDKLWKLQVEGDQVLPMFVYRMLRSSRARQYFMSNASGAAGVKNISKRKVLDLRIPIPSLDLQQEFIDLVQQVEKKRAVESVRLEKIAELRNSLISRVFRDNFGT